ncbi:diguanylate cyclase [Thioalkalivibrio sp. AKL17]|uniref:diguanylate cyclase n=1 Tax=Thioalkalivibrio sp. AKL17 TaxID=1158160 RepID=UPI000370EF15|nr:diguanylate cyclase [Thioalkalivibrio sp. AKL17]
MPSDEPPRILVVDDERINVQMLHEMLRNEYRVSVALDGEQALQRARTVQPSLILLDVQMEGMDGYEVCRRLQADEATRGIPVIFVTAMDSEEDERRGLDLGAMDYITKPFRPSIVQARIRNHLELKRQRDLLNRLSSIDGLTGLANRRHFEHTLEREWKNAARSETSLGLLLLDIDHFKHYNDHYGHQAGDETLIAVAGTVADSTRRPTDLAARYGGEEFVCVLPNTDLDGARTTGETIRAAVHELAIPSEAAPAGRVTVSVGATALQPGPEETGAAMLVHTADQLLYRAKEAGRDRVVAEALTTP